MTDFLHHPPPGARVEPITLTDVTRAEEYEKVIQYLPGQLHPLLHRFVREIDEIKMDSGKLVQVRFSNVHIQYDLTVDQQDLDQIERLVKGFKSNNRKGIPGTLHRVSKSNNDLGTLDKITFRIGRLLRGPAEPFRDVISGARGIGICGRPASGKTTFLRDAILMDGEMQGGGVNVVDTSNEIMGEGDDAHPAFSNVRQNKVGSPENLVPVLRNAIRSEGTVRLYADEVGYEPGDVRMIMQADRFVNSVTSSVHGYNLEDVLDNDLLHGLFGIRELPDGRRQIVGRPAFESFIEIRRRGWYVLHRDLAKSVKAIIEGSGKTDAEHVLTRVI